MEFNRKQRFSIRKYAFGAASVLIGTLIFGVNVKADSVEIMQAPATEITREETNSIETDGVFSDVFNQENSSEKKSESTTATETTTSVATENASDENATLPSETTASTDKEQSSTDKAEVISDTNKDNATSKEDTKVESEKIIDSKEEVKSSKSETPQTDSAITDTEEATENQLDLERAHSEAKIFKQIVTNVSENKVPSSEGSQPLSEEAIKELEGVKSSLNTAIANSEQALTNKQLTLAESKEKIATLNASIQTAYVTLKKLGYENVSYVLDTTTPLSKTEQENHFKQYQGTDGYNKHITDLNNQLFFVDWSDKAAVSGIGETINFKGQIGYELRVGTTWTKEISPGYIVTIKVKELKNIVGEENGVPVKEGTQAYKERQTDRYNKRVFAYKENFNKYSAIARNNLTAPGFSTISGELGLPGQRQSSGEFNNLGITFDVSATYYGRSVKPNIFVTSSEEANQNEAEIYKTNGSAWQLLTEIMGPSTVASYRVSDRGYLETMFKRIFQNTGHNENDPDVVKEITRLTEAVLNKTLTPETIATGGNGSVKSPYIYDGLGTQTFGPYVNSINENRSTPIVLTKGASEVSLYMISSGAQATTIGFVALDEGDAPDSYGVASHLISSGRGGMTSHPFIGSVKGDLDEEDASKPKTPWLQDEKNETVDEGARQLMGDNVEKNDNYTLHKADDKTYVLKLLADPNGNPESYVKGWVDFNNNGKFDENEASNLVKVTAAGTIQLTFSNIPQSVDTTLTRLGVRIRTAKDAEDIATPTGLAYSGEVEDFQIQQTIPPRGELKETIDVQGKTQSTQLHFTAYGELDNDLAVTNTIDNTKAYKFVIDGIEQSATTLMVVGQGTYTLNPTTGEITFTPEPDFIGKTTGVVVRAWDKNGASTGWTAETDINGLQNINKIQDTYTMDSVYIPTVIKKEIVGQDKTSTDVQGKAQQGKPLFVVELQEKIKQIEPSRDYPAKLVDKSGALVDQYTVDGEGTYSIDPTTGVVTFTPLPRFIGTATPALVKLTGIVGYDKDNNPITSTAQAHYTPTVTKVTPTASPAVSEGVQGEPQTGTPTFTAGDSAIPIQADSVTLIDEKGNSVLSVPAKDASGKEIGTYTVDPTTGVVTFTPTDKSYVGQPVPATVQAKDANGTAVQTTFTVKAIQVTPTATDKTSTGIQGLPQTGKVEFQGGKATANGVEKTVPIDEKVPATFEDGKTTKEVPGEGTYTVDPDGTVTFTPEKGFTGVATGVTVVRQDTNGTKVSGTFTATVTKVTPTASPAVSEGVQGDTQSGKPTFTAGDSAIPIQADSVTLIDASGNPATSVPAKDASGKEIGTYTVDPTTGVVTFTPTDKSYVGQPVPATVQAKDANGTAVQTTFTVKAIQVTPTATDKTSTGIQGLPQTGKVEFQGGKATANGVEKTVPIDEKVPATFEDGKTTKEVPGEGTYTVDPDGTVTFTPEKGFTGVATGVTVVRQDTNGTKVSGTFTATVTKVTPTASPAVSEGVQGEPQTGTPTFTAGDSAIPIQADSVTLIDEKGNSVLSVPAKDASGKEIGTYTVDPTTGVVTFTPTDKSYVGQPVPATVQAKDANGTAVQTTFTVKAIQVTPTATDKTSTGIQGLPQTGKVEFQGGKATANGVEKTVPIDEKVPATFEDGKTTKEVPGEGTYTVDPDGTVTFTPEKGFTGVATGVTVVRQDTNGTKVSGTFTATVTKVTPTASPAVSEGVQGEPQTGTPTFTAGDSAIPIQADSVTLIDATGNPATSVPAKDASGKEIGTYTVDPTTGVVTFTPTDKSYVGQPVPATVQAKDANGTAVQTTFTVKAIQVTPTATDKTSTGIQGLPQTGKVEFQGGKATANGVEKTVPIDEKVPATFEDGKTTKEVPGEGTYTVDPDGTVTFTPEKGFTGVATGVTVVRQDTNGTKVSGTFTATVTKVTPTASPAVSEGVQGDTQSGKPTFTAGDSAIPIQADSVTLIDEKGNSVLSVPAKDASGKEIGTYTVDPTTGVVTFTPTDKSYVGQPVPATVQAKDANGTAVQTTFTVKAIQVTPTATDKTSTGSQGLPQSVKLEFKGGKVVINGVEKTVPIDETVPATFDDGSTIKVIPGEGTYTVDPDGTVTFTPEKGFTGVARGVTVVRQDINGTKVSAHYAPTVSPAVPEKPIPEAQSVKMNNSAPQVIQEERLLPKTGENETTTMTALGLLTLLSVLTSLKVKKRD
ncbi:MAG: CshA/CshB family fibrillar adhesin-related protein [Streptococcus sp.]|nr:CshA/CshB family fibrillar adhesin-related protein [Streptococcus sp.]